MSTAVSRLKKGQTQTVLQYGLEKALWVQRKNVGGHEKLMPYSNNPVPAWTKLKYLGLVTRAKREYPIFEVLRFDKLVDMSALEITPAIQKAADFGRDFEGTYLVLEPDSIEYLDV